jgi:hypothetical protein
MDDKPKTFLDGREFVTHSGGYARAKITVQASEDDMNWALMRLGQYVDASHNGHPFRAYIYSAGATVDHPRLITVLAEPL